MIRYLLAAAAVAAIGFSGAAFAEDGKATSAQAVVPKAMTDAEMDKVTAGQPAGHLGEGTDTAGLQTGKVTHALDFGLKKAGGLANTPSEVPGRGVCTAGVGTSC